MAAETWLIIQVQAFEVWTFFSALARKPTGDVSDGARKPPTEPRRS